MLRRDRFLDATVMNSASLLEALMSLRNTACRLGAASMGFLRALDDALLVQR